MSWQDMNQAELDAAYDQAVFAPNQAQVLDRMATNSIQVRLNLGDPQRFQYGDTSIEGGDIFPSGQQGSPTLIFVHGGSWRFGSAKDNAFAAENFVSQGVNFVVPDFSSVLEFNGDLDGLLTQLVKMVSWVYHHASEFGGDPEQIYLCGFSSGAHLAGVLLIQEWETMGLPADLFKGALLCSGMYDMRPVAKSSRREYVSLNEENIKRLSPQLNLSRLKTPLIIAYGTLESPEFQRQGQELFDSLKSEGNEAELVIADHYNHFEIIETLANPHGVIGAAMGRLLEQVSGVGA